MSSKAVTKENGLSPVKYTRESSESTFKSSSKTDQKSSTNTKSFLSMFQNSNSRPKFQRQNIISQPLLDASKENSPEKLKSKDNTSSNKTFYNSTQVSDTNKMVVSFQTGNSGTNHSSTNTNNSISCRSNTGSALNFVSSTNGTRPANKPAAGKVLKNGSSSNPSITKGKI